MDEKQLWEKAVAFHGHVCGGLMIGYKASLYAIELLGLTFSDGEQVVCVAENDACGVDAVQAVLGCSVGKGNLLFHMRGKQAFSFYCRGTGQSVRLVLRPKPGRMTREESFAYYEAHEPRELFDRKETAVALRFFCLRRLRRGDGRELDPAGGGEEALPGLLEGI